MISVNPGGVVQVRPSNTIGSVVIMFSVAPDLNRCLTSLLWNRILYSSVTQWPPG